MANHSIPDNPEFSSVMRIVETVDLVHADVVNPLFRTLLLDAVYLYNQAAKQRSQIESMAAGSIIGGDKLSSEAVTVDADAEFPVIQKTSSTAQAQPLFSKMLELRKGLYGFAIRMKVSAINDANGLVQIAVSSGGTIIEQRTLTADMLEAAGKYQTLGFNVDVQGEFTVSATLLTNSANITVSIDYIMFQPSHTTITAL